MSPCGSADAAAISRAKEKVQARVGEARLLDWRWCECRGRQGADRVFPSGLSPNLAADLRRSAVEVRVVSHLPLGVQDTEGLRPPARDAAGDEQRFEQ